MFSLQAALNWELANISKYLKDNKQSLNIKDYVHDFHTKQIRPADVKIEIDNEIISETKYSKFLGFILKTS